ncbi:TetR/AcrR family transcriptional regulator [Allostreptomyces psammosilenae]|uniref:AcrR family transcriptional regulator n=1 Tax=Allostreptomyces psammosilenae TaxID=1892865 RepID=A0A852ZPV2_9ACTN|nr:TetR/AcrR family transcriptional regulator [Allostreptomyces psammosilenae]NYI04399.1 AcrR family transcriptional regulator [Allostreptomyces psammosilenae]
MAIGSPPPLSPRARRIAEASCAVLAEHGPRGLTHRAVDAAAGLPVGSTSNVARSRRALLELTLRHIAERERGEITPLLDRALSEPPDAGAAAPAGPPEPAEVAALLAAHLRQAVTTERARTAVRFELALEAVRRPELAPLYTAAGAEFRRQAVEIVRALGSRAPERHGWSLLAYVQGVLFHTVAGGTAVPTPTERELTVSLTELLTGMLAEPGADGAPG